MRIRILGSAAAEAWPALFCECEACQKAWKNGGKDFRRRCAYLIDDDTLLDIGPDIYGQSLEFRIDLSHVKRLLVSHSHSDHLTPLELAWRRPGYSKVTRPLAVYGDQLVLDKLAERLNSNWEYFHIQPHLVLPGDKNLDGDLEFTAILANHAAPPEQPVNYILQRNGKTAFVGTDSGWWCDESWDIIKFFQYDIVIIESTFGLLDPDKRNGHMGAATSVCVRDEFQKLGLLKKDCLVAVNHFSHNCLNMHNDLERYFLPKGIMVGYDGMLLEA